MYYISLTFCLACFLLHFLSVYSDKCQLVLIWIIYRVCIVFNVEDYHFEGCHRWSAGWKYCKFLAQTKNNELCLLIYVIDFIFSVRSMTFFQVRKCFAWKLLVRGMSDPMHSQPSICFFTDNFKRPHFSSVIHRAPFSWVGFLASLGFV